MATKAKRMEVFDFKVDDEPQIQPRKHFPKLKNPNPDYDVMWKYQFLECVAPGSDAVKKGTTGATLSGHASINGFSDSKIIRRAKAQTMTCKICFEETHIKYIFAVDVCLHKYCFTCMKRHVEQKFLKGMTAECPHEGCKSKLKVENCEKFLEPEAIEVMMERMMEASLPAADKLYCPYPRCSTLMSKSSLMRKKISRHDQSGVRICIKCLRLHCIDCKVPWHKDVTCDDYRRSNPYPLDEQSLRYLATTKHWRQCTLCNNMIELAGGCFHITCTCGYQFCYTCGAEWKNGIATCKCRFWEEHNIIDGYNREA